MYIYNKKNIKTNTKSNISVMETNTKSNKR